MTLPKVLFKGKMFRVERATYRIKGRSIVGDSVVGANTVGTLPVFDDGRILLERQFRYPTGRYIYEIPAGHIENGESAREAAFRELEEETGYRAKTLQLMFRAYPSPGIKTEFASYYIARNLSKTKTRLEYSEIITTKTITFERALRMVRKNEIIDLKTIACLLFYRDISRF